MSIGRPTCDRVSIEESIVSNIWEIAATVEYSRPDQHDL
jgi:hypothetical protein